MSALPSDADFDAEGISIWSSLLSAEEAALQEQQASKYRDNLVGVRVLGWFLRDFWKHPSHRFGNIPYRRLLLEITSCLKVDSVVVGSLEETKAQHEKLYALGLMYRNHLMRVIRSDAGSIPTPSRHVSRPSFDNYKEKILSEMARAPQTKADVKALALHRDGYKCMITGAYDWNMTDVFPEILEQLDTGFVVLTTKCAHLFSESAQAAGKEEYAATAFTMLEMFGLKDEVDQLLGGQVNDLRNVLTMTQQLHTLFDKFDFWLEEVEREPNTYNVVATRGHFYNIPGVPRRVTFKVDPAVVKECERKSIPVPPLPDPNLIAIRASCARVAHMSGAAEQNSKILRDREMIPVLASDGSNADLLNSLLSRSLAGVKVGG